MQQLSSNPFRLPSNRPSLGQIHSRLHDDPTGRARSVVEIKRRVSREAAREWILLLGSPLLVVAATVGIVAAVMR